MVDSADDIAWDETADVVVVGYGGAGAAAALQARESGAGVLLVERFGGGGTTKYSGGVIYAGHTDVQREAGFDDTVENMHAYLRMEIGDVVRPETLRRFCEGSAADIAWLAGHGVPFGAQVYLEKTTFPPEGKFLYYSGNEKLPSFAAHAEPMPRGHRVVGPGYGGAHYVAALGKALERSCISLRTHARATRLVTDRGGRVIGLEILCLPETLHAEHEKMYERASPWRAHNAAAARRAGEAAWALEQREGKAIRVRARAGVILATGGFSYSKKLLLAHEPGFARHYDRLHRLATLGNDGAGIELGQSAGGATKHMDALYIARNIAPPASLLHGVLVNQEGRRFVPEDAYTGNIGGAIARQSAQKAWLIVPVASVLRALKEAVSCGWHNFRFFGLPALANIFLGGTKLAVSISSAARACGIDPAALHQSFAAHDKDLADGVPDRHGLTSAARKRLGNGPFVIINMALSNRHAFTPYMTLGGLVVDESSGMVLRADGAPVDGLYAAGLCAVGLHSAGYISGISLADGVFSGRRAGRHCARRVHNTVVPTASDMAQTVLF
jgi:3-oxo-5alpha-steroid 4-dehydrogenase